MTVVSGYNVWPSDELRQLRADFPSYLIFELHNQQEGPRFVATHMPPTVSGADDVVIAANAEALRNRLVLQPTTRPLPHRGGGQS